MDLGLSGKGAVVWAASAGLGKASALALACEGVRVVVCSRDKKRIEAAAEEITEASSQSGGSAVPVVADVSNPGDILRAFETAGKTLGTVDILVTNAGGPPSGLFPDLTDDQWQTGFERNLLSVIRCIRPVIPGMQSRNWGRIINITSHTVKAPTSDLVVSSVVRPGILGLSRVLANTYGKNGITVNNVAPGLIMTGRQQELGDMRSMKQGISFEEYVRQSSEMIPAGRFGTPRELGSVIAFLASREASYVNGVTISIDGGLVRGLF